MPASGARPPVEPPADLPSGTQGPEGLPPGLPATREPSAATAPAPEPLEGPPEALVIALAQIDATPGDLEGNAARILSACRQAAEKGAHLVVTPELALTGYSPRDLLFRSDWDTRVQAALEGLAAGLGAEGPELLVGTTAPAAGEGKPVVNAVAHLGGGACLGIVGEKRLLPTYDVFDERRHFAPGAPCAPLEIAGHRIGVTICEDIWVAEDARREVPRHAEDPAAEQCKAGATVLLNLSASPFGRGRPALREDVVQATARRTGRPVLQCNLAGAVDEIVFDGASVVVDADGGVVARGRPFDEDLILVTLEGGTGRPLAAGAPRDWPDRLALLRKGLVRGLADYVRKTGHERVLLGLSGGIDSSLVAALAVEALGPEAVRGVAMPSRYSSAGALEDAEALARGLGIRHDVVPIETIHEAFERALDPILEPAPFGPMEENLQARARGTLLMAIANREHRLLLTTGNKSELAVGYCTLYGDMNGALGPIGDLWKTEVFALAEVYVREGKIPESSLRKPPSAELRPDQKDEDSLPPYADLDRVLMGLVEEDCGPAAIEARYPEIPEETIRCAQRLLALNEWKRRQAAPVLRVTTKAFGFGRRIPIVHRDPPDAPRTDRRESPSP